MFSLRALAALCLKLLAVAVFVVPIEGAVGVLESCETYSGETDKGTAGEIGDIRASYGYVLSNGHDIGLTAHDLGLLLIHAPGLNSDEHESHGNDERRERRAGLHPVRLLWPVVIGSILLSLAGIPVALIAGLWRNTGVRWLDRGWIGVGMVWAGAIGFILAARADLLGCWALW